MQLTKISLIALFSVAALACSQDKGTTEKTAAPQAEQAAADQTAEATPTAVAAAPAAAPAHECGGAKKHEGGGCGDMMKAEGGGCNQWDEAAQEVTARDVPQGAVWASYNVDGMTCGGCERRIQAKVGEIEGVVAVEASAELGKVRVAVAPEAKDSHDLAKARIAELGYKVR